MKKSLILLVLPLLLAGGCGKDNNPVDAPPSLEDLVIANCYELRDFVEAYAAQNGQYPSWLGGRPWINNPFTGNLTQPLNGFALNPGETGYISYSVGQKTEGYLITGFGETNEIISLKKNYPDSILAIEHLVLANCYAVRTAAEAFAAENNGEYPYGTSARTPLGNNLYDLLPGGVPLENPFTRIRTEPTDGTASQSGETAYTPVVDNRVNAGYSITGYGATSIIVWIPKYPGQQF